MISTKQIWISLILTLYISTRTVDTYPTGATLDQCESMSPMGPGVPDVLLVENAFNPHGPPSLLENPYLIIPDMIEYEPLVPVSGKLRYIYICQNI